MAGITPAGPTSGSGDPAETLTNTTAAPITVRYVYTLTANGCTNPSTYNVDVVVNPNPNAYQFAYAACDMQRLGIQLYTCERNGRDQLRVDQGSSGRNNTCRSDVRIRRPGRDTNEHNSSTVNGKVCIYTYCQRLHQSINIQCRCCSQSDCRGQPACQPGICNGSATTAVTFGTPNTGGTVTYTWTNDR